MKVLQVVTLSLWGGAQRVALDYAKVLKSQGVDVSIASSPGGRLEKEAMKNDIGFFPLPFQRGISPLKDTSALFLLKKLIKEGGFSVVHSHSTKAGFLSRLPLVPGIKIFTVHGWCFTPGTGREFCRYAEKFLARFTRKITCVSRFDLNLGRQAGIPEDKLFYLPNGIEDTEKRAEPEKSQLVVSVARFSPQKDHFTLLRALARLEDTRALLVGDGPLLERAKSLARALGIGRRVEFVGEVEDVEEILSRAGLFVLSSKWEGLPLSVIEAMRAGLPVVATDVGGVGELVRHGENGFLVEKGDVEGLMEGIRSLLLQPSLRKIMGERGRRIYLENYTYGRMKEGLIELYRNL